MTDLSIFGIKSIGASCDSATRNIVFMFAPFVGCGLVRQPLSNGSGRTPEPLRTCRPQVKRTASGSASALLAQMGQAINSGIENMGEGVRVHVSIFLETGDNR